MKASEAAAWPYVARIRANCGVELTLDRCVQTMRRKIQEENSNPEFTRQKIDRTPSFYTSRSLINLSGLSVSDPLPNGHFDGGGDVTLSVPVDDIPLSEASTPLHMNNYEENSIDSDVGYDMSCDSRDDLMKPPSKSTKIKKYVIYLNNRIIVF